jgi:putative DNA primase/helicase
MVGQRLIETQEAPAGKFFNEALLKTLTGEDVVSARFMNKDFFEFMPQCKIWMTSNYRPRLQNHDLALRRRTRILPFDQQPRTINVHLTQQIVANELPGVMAWCLEGVRWWLLEGIGSVEDAPAQVRDATDDYFRSEDSIGLFLTHSMVEETGTSCSTDSVWHAYVQWCNENGENARNKKSLIVELQDRGLRVTKIGPADKRVAGFEDRRVVTDFDGVG